MNCANHQETPATAYCRTCGKALCEECKRDVMGVIYCEPCIAARMQGTMPAAGVGGAAAAASSPGAVGAAVPGAPNPALAAILGLIPFGVGAFYNGQFVKGIVHAIIFIALVWGADKAGPADWVFGMLIPVWIFYMAFDAYRTAKARQLGQPLPQDMFGLNTESGELSGVARDFSGIPTGAIVLIGLGVLFMLENIGVFHWHWIGKLWPIILILIGLRIIFRHQQTQAPR